MRVKKLLTAHEVPAITDCARTASFFSSLVAEGILLQLRRTKPGKRPAGKFNLLAWVN
jgi:hypothetical protein